MFGGDFGEAVSEAEAEQAERFWEDLAGERTVVGPQQTTQTRRQRMQTTCIRANRLPAFLANLTPTTTMPRMEICRLFVTKRAGVIPGAPVVGPDGESKPEPDRGEGPGAGTGNLQPDQVPPHIAPKIHSTGTGFFITPTRIVTAAHVVLDATEIIVVPGKMGPRSGTGATSPAEPFGRFSVTGANVAVNPAIFTAPAAHFFSEDFAVIRNFTPIKLPNGNQLGRRHRLVQPIKPNRCVHTCGYSAVAPADGNFQHCDRGFLDPVPPPPVPTTSVFEFNLMSTRGASGSPIWQDPPPGSPAGTRNVIGIVVSGNPAVPPSTIPTHTTSPVLNAGRINFLRTA